MPKVKGRGGNGPVKVAQDDDEGTIGLASYEKTLDDIITEDPRLISTIQFVKIKKASPGEVNPQIRFSTYPSSITLGTWLRENDPTGTFKLDSDVHCNAHLFGLKQMKVKMNKLLEEMKGGKKSTNEHVLLHQAFSPLEKKLSYLVALKNRITDNCRLIIIADGITKDNLVEELIAAIKTGVKKDYVKEALTIVAQELREGHAAEAMRIRTAVDYGRVKKAKEKEFYEEESLESLGNAED